MASTDKLAPASIDRKPTAAERRGGISSLLAQSSYMSIADLAGRFSVSEMTIRRDLDVLVAQGVVERAHGGAVTLLGQRAARMDLFEPAFDERLRENSAAKAQIAKAAAALIEPQQTIGIDIGSTAMALAQAIQGLDVRVFTSSMKIGLMLSNTAARVYLPGGEIRGTEPSLTGDMARRQLENFRFDWAFLGASGIADDGIYDYSLDDSEIKRALIGGAEKVVALMDASKFNRLSVVKICELSAIDMLITDRAPDDALAAKLKAADIRIEIAG